MALVKAWKGDKHGNLVYRHTAQNFNPGAAMSGKLTVAEVAILVDPGQLAPEQIHTPGIYVQRLVHNPNGSFAEEIVPVPVATRKGTVLTSLEEGVRPDTSLEALAYLKPAFKPGGSITAGNASSLNDGAAMLVLCDAAYAQAQGLEPLAEIVGYACMGVDPALMGIGPAAAVPRALQRAGLDLDDVDLFELKRHLPPNRWRCAGACTCRRIR